MKATSRIGYDFPRLYSQAILAATILPPTHGCTSHRLPGEPSVWNLGIRGFQTPFRTDSKAWPSAVTRTQAIDEKGSLSMAARKRSRDDDDLVDATPQSDAYTGMLAIAFVATITGLIFLWLDYPIFPR
jgi:hypothetical protein